MYEWTSTNKGETIEIETSEAGWIVRLFSRYQGTVDGRELAVPASTFPHYVGEELDTIDEGTHHEYGVDLAREADRLADLGEGNVRVISPGEIVM